jgi:hypothetical protein
VPRSALVPGSHPADLARLEAIATGADPADHSSRWAPSAAGGAPQRPRNGHRPGW